MRPESHPEAKPKLIRLADHLRGSVNDLDAKNEIGMHLTLDD
jgi:hypothetical protein